MSKSNHKELEVLLEKLNKSTNQILTKSNYTNEVKRLKVLEELIREQLNNEDTYSTVSKIR